MQLTLDRIHPDPDNIRGDSYDDDIAPLAADIARHGLLQPLVVYPVDDGYMLTAGHRRFFAVQALGWADVEAKVIDPPANDLERLDRMASENLQRRQINPIEEARYYQRCIDAGRSQTEIAASVGVAQSKVSSYLMLLDLPADIRSLVAQRRMNPTNAIAMAKRRRQESGAARSDAGGTHNRGYVVPWFDGAHPQRLPAAAHCAHLQHSPDLRIGGACGQCWEWAILRAASATNTETRSEADAPPCNGIPRPRERFSDPREILRRLKCTRCSTPAIERDQRRCFTDRDGRRHTFDHHEFVMEVAADA